MDRSDLGPGDTGMPSTSFQSLIPNSVSMSLLLPSDASFRKPTPGRTLRLPQEKNLSHRSSLYLNLVQGNSIEVIDIHVPRHAQEHM